MTFSAGTYYGPTTREISDVFARHVEAHGGTILDTFDDGERLFLRATLPMQAEVRRGDAIKHGIAIRAGGPELVVHPFTFRQVCTNGAVMARAHQSSQLERIAHDGVVVPGYEVAVTLAQLSDALSAAAAPEAFAQAMTELRASLNSSATFMSQFLPLIHRFGRDAGRRFYERVLSNFEDENDRSTFALMNAITAVARDERDPEIRWMLEVIGGSLPARVHAARPEPTLAASPTAR
jgi:hypothetical protein